MDFREGPNCLSVQHPAGLPRLWSAGATLEAWTE